MSSYYLDYSQLTGKEKRAKAFRDAQEWWGAEYGEKVMDTLMDILNDENLTLRQKVKYMRFAISFSGVSGYPIKAIVRIVYDMWKVR